jgi:hypothetical protein
VRNTPGKKILLVFAGLLYIIAVPSYALPAGAGQRYIPSQRYKSTLEPPSFKVFHSTCFLLAMFTDPFALKQASA